MPFRNIYKELNNLIMKKIKTQIKLIALVLSVLILFQGCTIYKTTPVSLDQAAKEEIKTKVFVKSDENLIFRRIAFEEGKFYGVTKEKGEIVKILLDEQFIDNVKVKDKVWSTIATLGLSVVSLFGILMGVWLISGGAY